MVADCFWKFRQNDGTWSGEARGQNEGSEQLQAVPSGFATDRGSPSSISRSKDNLRSVRFLRSKGIAASWTNRVLPWILILKNHCSQTSYFQNARANFLSFLLLKKPKFNLLSPKILTCLCAFMFFNVSFDLPPQEQSKLKEMFEIFDNKNPLKSAYIFHIFSKD